MKKVLKKYLAILLGISFIVFSIVIVDQGFSLISSPSNMAVIGGIVITSLGGLGFYTTYLYWKEILKKKPTDHPSA